MSREETERIRAELRGRPGAAERFETEVERMDAERVSSCVRCGRDLHHDERLGWLDAMNRTDCVETYRPHEATAPARVTLEQANERRRQTIARYWDDEDDE